jgi:hypothetical protein
MKLNDKLADIDQRIAEGESRLAELRTSPMERAMASVLIENVTATLKLLREHKVRLEQHMASVAVAARRS